MKVGPETAIMDILLDNDLLVFNREQMIEESVLPRMSVKKFERRYLRMAYDQKILILRVIDSRGEEFNLSKVYSCQVDVINVITAPEIEMLIIASKKKYDEYCRSALKSQVIITKTSLELKMLSLRHSSRNTFRIRVFLLTVLKNTIEFISKKIQKHRYMT